jgi:hypothetical protein
VEEKNDGLVKVGPMIAMVGDWEKFLEEDATEDEAKKLRQHERTVALWEMNSSSCGLSS